MPRKPSNPITGSESRIKNDEIDCAFQIDQGQLDGARIFSSREEFVKHLPKGIKFMEVGVAWGYYSKLVADQCNPSSIDLVDWYNQDLKCWSWRKFGECQCTPKHELKYDADSHEQYIIEEFAKYKNVKTYKGEAEDILSTMNKDYDYIYLDITNDRKPIWTALDLASKCTKVDGIIGLNDYVIYDGVIEDKPYATFQVVNEFLKSHSNWRVHSLAFHVLGFNDIYLKRCY